MGVKVGIGVGVCVGTGVNVAVGVCVGAGTSAGVGVSSGSPHSVIVAPMSATVKKIAHTEMKLKPQPLSFVRNLSRRPSFIFAQLTRCNELGRKRNKPTAAHSKSAKSWPLNSPPSRDTTPIPPTKTIRVVSMVSELFVEPIFNFWQPVFLSSFRFRARVIKDGHHPD